MGASSWAYFTPYQKDVKKAFNELRKKVFEKGDYYDPYAMFTDEYFSQFSDEEVQSLKDSIESIRKIKVNSIEDLLKKNAESGTHSILDIREINETDELWKSGKISDDNLIEIFSTLKPTHEMIVEKENSLYTFRGRWLCTYIVVFKNDEPTEIYFTGYSGD